MAFATIEEAEAAIKDLRNENAKWRLQVRTHEDTIADLTATADKSGKEKETVISGMKAEHETALKAVTDKAIADVAEVKSSVKEQVKLSKLEALAVKEGLVDLDALKLLDLSKIELQDDGTLKGTEDVFKAAKEAKPYLFGEVKSSTPPGGPPKKGDDKTVDVRTMTPEEYKVHKANVLAT